MATIAELVDAIQMDDATQVHNLVTSDPALVNARTQDGLSMVMLAQYYRRTDIVTLLVENNAQLDLYDAAAIGDTARASGWLAMHPGLANTYSPDGYTPLGLAAFFGRLPVAEILLNAHADPNIISNNPMHVAPLNSAVAGDHLELAAKLLEAGANVNSKQAEGFTSLMGAAQNGNLPAVSCCSTTARMSMRVWKSMPRNLRT